MTAEQDAADGGLQGEAWRHFLASWRLTGGIGGESRGYEAAFPNSPRFRDQPPEFLFTTFNSNTPDGEPFPQGHSYRCSYFVLIAHSSP